MDCLSICGARAPEDFGESEAELLRALYIAYTRLGPPGACYVVCKAIDRLCAALGNCDDALKEFVRRYPRAAELYRAELLRVAAASRRD